MEPKPVHGRTWTWPEGSPSRCAAAAVTLDPVELLLATKVEIKDLVLVTETLIPSSRTLLTQFC